MSESCENCRFSAPVTDPKWEALTLECRRRPPVQGQRPAAEWPMVPDDGWCGEYDARPATSRAPAKKRPAVGEVETRSGEQG